MGRVNGVKMDLFCFKYSENLQRRTNIPRESSKCMTIEIVDKAYYNEYLFN